MGYESGEGGAREREGPCGPLCDQAMRAAGSGITLPRKASPPKIHRPRIAAKPASDIVRFLVMLFLAGALWGVRVEPSEVLIVVFSDASVVFLG